MLNGIIKRRSFVVGSAALCSLPFVSGAASKETLKEISSLKPGEFTWHPERQLHGPVAVVVSLTEQRVHVYRNGIRIGVSTCSTGKPGHETPTGVFVVLQKDKDHKSSTYNNAAMPNMNRLTWSGIALHAGALPGYPASHGCVRLPMEFSERLFETTHLGTPVIIADAHSDPWELVHPGMVLGAYAEAEFAEAVGGLKARARPGDWAKLKSEPVTSVILSSSDRRVMLLENSHVLAEGPLTVTGSGALGSHVFVLHNADDAATGLRWISISHGADADDLVEREDRLLARLTVDPTFLTRMRARLHPGTILILTDAPLVPDTRSGKDFVIMT